MTDLSKGLMLGTSHSYFSNRYIVQGMHMHTISKIESAMDCTGGGTIENSIISVQATGKWSYS